MVGKSTAFALVGLAGLALAQSPFKVDSSDSILESTKTLASDLIAFYHGDEPGKTVGILDGPPVGQSPGGYYWWQSGSYWNTILEYRRITGDQQYDKLVSDALVAQSGSDMSREAKYIAFLPANWTASMGNDDQCTWGLAALHAAETGFPDHKGDGFPTWEQMAVNVFGTQQDRWSMELEPAKKSKNGTCGGGLRWQLMPTNAGYDYKNTISNGCHFQLASRLGQLTGNKTYTDVAAKTFEWMQSVGLIDRETWAVYDGAHTGTNCTDINKAQFSAVTATLINGAAHMYNSTGSDVWRTRLDKLLSKALGDFFKDGAAYEVACEAQRMCTTDMWAFKGILHRELSRVPALAPHTNGTLAPVLRKSAEAAVKQCTGGESKRQCGFYWSEGEFVKPKTTGVGEAMGVLSAVQGMLALEGKVAVGGAGGAKPGNGDAGAGAGAGTDKKEPSGAAGARGVQGLTWMVVVGVVGALVM